MVCIIVIRLFSPKMEDHLIIIDLVIKRLAKANLMVRFTDVPA